MKNVVTVLAALVVSGVSAHAQMGTGRGGDMMGGSSVWGMNSGWPFGLVMAILVVVAIAYLMTRK